MAWHRGSLRDFLSAIQDSNPGIPWFVYGHCEVSSPAKAQATIFHGVKMTMVQSQPLKADSSSLLRPSSRRAETMKRTTPPTNENTLDMISKFRTESFSYEIIFFRDGPFPVSFSFIVVFSKFSTITLKNFAVSENRTGIFGVEIQNADRQATTTA